MKIAPAPSSANLPKGGADLRAAAAPAPSVPAPLADPCAFDRTLRLCSGDAIDEAAVVLVDLAVLVYNPLETVRRVLAHLGLASFAAFDAYEDRGPDIAWLQREADLRARPASAPRAPTDDPAQILARALQSLRDAPLPEDAVMRDRRSRRSRVLAFRHGSKAYVVFRGTLGLYDWILDLMAGPAWRLPWRHEGFEICWTEVRTQVQDWLAREAAALGRAPEVYLGGHSLGGAVATLAALDLAALGYPIARVVTIGSPRPGGYGLRRLYARAPATPSAEGSSRNAVAATTRFVHGTDIFATILPPPPIAVHVCPPRPFTAEDRVTVQEFVGPNGPYDTSAVLALLGGAAPAPPSPFYTRGSAPVPPTSRRTLLRNAATQLATWISMSFPQLPYARLLPFLPALVEQTRVSLFQHKSARYLGFLPFTPLREAMLAVTAPPEPAAPAAPARAGELHVVKPS